MAGNKTMPLSWLFDECSVGAYWHDITRKMMDKLVKMNI